MRVRVPSLPPEIKNMEFIMGIIGLLILGWCTFMLIRHPFKSLGFLIKVSLLLLLGFGVYLALFGWVMMSSV